MKKREVTIPTLVGLLVTAAGLVTGLWLVKSRTGSNIKADAGEAPKEVRISNVTDSGFTVSWITDKAATGFVQHAEGNGGTEAVTSDDRDQQKAAIESYFTHYVSIKAVKPETTYKFKIGSGSKLYDLEGQPYQVATAKKLNSMPAADVAYGQANTKNGEPAEGAIVYLQLPDTVLQSALVKTSGSWVAPLATARTTELDEYAKYDLKNEILEIDIQGGPLGTTSLVTKTGSDSPVPNLVLGETYETTPKASEGLVVLTPQQGEKVNSKRPEIIGTAPAGSSVTIEVHSSQAINGTATADSNGNFSYSVPVDLAPGEHSVTISTAINGITQSITKSFTVYAAGESLVPAFSATPSGQISPTTKPTAAPTAKMASPTPTTKALPIPTTIVTPEPTPVTELESSGDAGFTIATLAMAGMLIITGSWWYRRAV